MAWKVHIYIFLFNTYESSLIDSIFALRSVKALQGEGITHIISVISDPIAPPPGLEDIKHMQIQADDYEDEVVLDPVILTMRN